MTRWTSSRVSIVVFCRIGVRDPSPTPWTSGGYPRTPSCCAGESTGPPEPPTSHCTGEPTGPPEPPVTVAGHLQDPGAPPPSVSTPRSYALAVRRWSPVVAGGGAGGVGRYGTSHAMSGPAASCLETGQSSTCYVNSRSHSPRHPWCTTPVRRDSVRARPARGGCDRRGGRTDEWTSLRARTPVTRSRRSRSRARSMGKRRRKETSLVAELGFGRGVGWVSVLQDSGRGTGPESGGWYPPSTSGPASPPCAPRTRLSGTASCRRPPAAPTVCVRSGPATTPGRAPPTSSTTLGASGTLGRGTGLFWAVSDGGVSVTPVSPICSVHPPWSHRPFSPTHRSAMDRVYGRPPSSRTRFP